MTIRSQENFKKKAEYSFNVKNNFIKFFFFIPFFCVSFGIQLYVSEKVGGFESLVIYYGNYYPNITLGSLWRFITGPMIHADLAHWLINAVLTILFASTISERSRFFVFSIFILGAITSHASAFLINTSLISSSDALVGLSGGAYSLLALSICYYAHQKKHFNVACSLFGLLVFGEVSSSVISDSVSHTAHLSGFLFGVLIYIVFLQKWPLTRRLV